MNAFVLVGEPREREAERLRAAMDGSAAVERYLYLPYGFATLNWVAWSSQFGGYGFTATSEHVFVRGDAVERCPKMLDPAFVVDLELDRLDAVAAFDSAIEPARRVVSEADDPFSAFPWFAEHPLPDREVDVEVFMKVDAAPEQVAAVAAALEADPRFASVRHLTKLDALGEMRRIFADQPDLIENVTAESLPESFRIFLVSPHDTNGVEEGLGALDGVDEVLVSSPMWVRFDVTRRPVVLPAPGTSAEVFMQVDAESGRVDAVRAALEHDPRVASVEHVSKSDALEEFRATFRDDPDLVASITADALPESFRVALVDEEQSDPFRDDVEGLRGVDQVILRFGGLESAQLCPSGLR